MKTNRLFVLMLGVMLAMGSAAFAEETAVPAVAAAPSEADQKAMMEKAKVLMAPSEAHKVLDNFVGQWNYTSKFWMDPAGEPEVSTGSATQMLVYGGRFLKQEVKGTWMGEAFEGVGYTGYDNVRQEYTSVWIDGMMTGIMVSAGQYDAATKTLRQAGTVSCPMTGNKNHPCRSELKIVDADHHTLTSYTNGLDGKEVKAMEIAYERVKPAV